jgi:CheY-like chemotaxis protein
VPHTLLLADDSVTIQRVIELTFADEDVQVVAVSDGDQAIAQLEASPPDIVLADVGMPGKNGYEVAEHMKRSPRLAHIPVVLLTGAFEPVDRARLEGAGCDGVLAKPFEPQLVIGRVKDLLSKPRQASAPQAPPPPGDRSSHSPMADVSATSTVKPPSGSIAAADLESYFDRLDAAFADLDAKSDPPKSPAPPPANPPEEIDWIGTFPDAPPADPPHASAAPTPHRSTLQQLPSPADASAANVVGEQGEASGVATTWPGAAASNTAAREELIDEVTRRVLDRLTAQHALRNTVSDIVSSIAERLVREEIERIKASIK